MSRSWPSGSRAGSRRAARRRRGPLGYLGDLLLAGVILGLLALLAARLDLVPASKSSGRATVADGDSIAIAGERIRLIGIDAPELGQTCAGRDGDYPCGKVARQALVDLIGGRAVDCSGWRRDRYGRLLASCAAGGIELNRRMVESGWAVAYGGFEAEEAEARAGGVGLWQGSFERPRAWRDAHGSAAEGRHDLLSALGDWIRGLFGG
ncbi:MAG: thermonuclease family protein [Rhizobiaceae bacterium]